MDESKAYEGEGSSEGRGLLAFFYGAALQAGRLPYYKEVRSLPQNRTFPCNGGEDV